MNRHVLTFCCALILFSPYAFAEVRLSDCTMDISAQRDSILDDKNVQARTISPVTYSNGIVEHKISLDDGTIVEFTEGGCVHYAMNLKVYPSTDFISKEDINTTMQNINTIFARLPIKEESRKRMTADWNKIKVYVSNKSDNTLYKLDSRTGRYIASPSPSGNAGDWSFVEKQICPFNGDPTCGVIINRNSFALYSTFIP